MNGKRYTYFITALVAIVTALLFCVSASQATTRPHRAKTKTPKTTAASPSAKTAAVQSVALNIILPDSKQVRLSGRMVNGRAYMPLAQVAQRLSDTLSTEKEVLQYDGSKIRCAPAGFLVTRESRLGMRFAQMAIPSLLLEGKTYIPVPHFFAALQTLGIFEVETGQEAISLKPYLSYRIDADLVRNTIVRGDETGKKETPKSSKEGKGDTSIKSLPTPKDTPPSRYQLPPDLKRRELDEPKKKNGSFLNPAMQLQRDYTLAPCAAEPSCAATLSAPTLKIDIDQLPLMDEEGDIASLVSNLKNTPTKVKEVYAEVKGSTTKIHFVGNKDFAAFAQPHMEKQTIVVRLPKAINGVHSLDNIRKLNFSKVRTYLDGEEQVYEFTLKRSDRKAQLEKTESGHLVLTIVPTTALASGDKEKKKWGLDVIVIDAGHGGKDNGAESIHGFMEKDVALSIALKLRNQINKLLPSTKVVMTRSTDVFVDLYERGEIANRAGGKLFICIHCNSMPTKPNPANGFETYVLSPAKSDIAINVATRENSVIRMEEKSERYKGMNDEQLIVATLAQNSFVKLSQQCATYVQQELDKSTTMASRGVNQAGFIVLIGASMPSVYVETGFLSNTSDEKVLSSDKGQLSIAKGIANAVKRYAKSYEKVLAQR